MSGQIKTPWSPSLGVEAMGLLPIFRRNDILQKGPKESYIIKPMEGRKLQAGDWNDKVCGRSKRRTRNGKSRRIRSYNVHGK
jgi:hypothetical protein